MLSSKYFREFDILLLFVKRYHIKNLRALEPLAGSRTHSLHCPSVIMAPPEINDRGVPREGVVDENIIHSMDWEGM